ncbi:MAG: CBS domain-containing protein [Desulfurococcales archaeon]|nr:CBS domain-containing protein [Desulfurococcales archaeon]
MATVAEYMRRDRIVTCTTDTSLREASRLMAENKVGSIIVVGDGMKLKGIFTERDLVRAIAGEADPDKGRVGDYITEHVVTVAPYESIVKAGQIMLEHGIRHLPVVDSSGRVVGVISVRDALRAILASSEFP